MKCPREAQYIMWHYFVSIVCRKYVRMTLHSFQTWIKHIVNVVTLAVQHNKTISSNKKILHSFIVKILLISNLLNNSLNLFLLYKKMVKSFVLHGIVLINFIHHRNNLYIYFHIIINASYDQIIFLFVWFFFLGFCYAIVYNILTYELWKIDTCAKLNYICYMYVTCVT